MFQAGLTEGRKRGAFYLADNKSGKTTSVEKMFKYASEHNYVVGKYATRTVDKFGDKAYAVDWLEFLPQEMYREYIYETLTTPSDPSYANITQSHKGSCYVYNDSKFTRLDNVYWTGEIVDGMLSGSGFGFHGGNSNPGAGTYAFISGAFQSGLPKGDSTCKFYAFDSHNSNPKEAKESGSYQVTVGELHEGMASYCVPSGKFGFVKSDGTITIQPTYELVIKDFSNGKAEVSKDGQEIIIGETGNMIDLTAKQKQIDAAQKAKEQQEALQKEQEKQRQEIAQRQKRIEEQRQAEEREKYRQEKLRKCQPGDKIYYSKDYHSRETFLGYTISRSSWTMRVVCFVEQNVNNGERLQIRVGSVESNNDDHYTTPEIDGMKYNKGDVFWIKPLNNSGWWVE